MKDRLVCSCLGVTYEQIRAVQAEEKLFTVAAIKKRTKAGTACRTCIPDLEQIVQSLCTCKQVSLSAVQNAVRSGARTVEAVQKETGAATMCRSCVPLIEALIAMEIG